MRSLPLALVFFTACSFNLGPIGYDIPYDIPEQTVPGNAAAHAAGVVVGAPLTSFPVNIDLAQQAKANGVTAFSQVTLQSLSLSITKNSGCFDFVQDVSITISSTKAGTTLQPAVIATGSNPGCVQTFNLQPNSTVDLKPYLDEGAQATPTAHGIPPASDVSFNGHLVAHAAL
ncbi:MAG TPA: hypothetical protein VLM85_33785 [Polyangiaceae bacterium]|nr:hypothetical protein [Polyangiaceae bacterium]